MKEIIGIEVVLENCEVIGFKREHIGHFVMRDIKRSIARVAMNSISESSNAGEVYIELSSKANESANFVTTFRDDEKPFDRLRNHTDITWIYVKYEDGSEEGISVEWDGVSDYTNQFQTTEINEHTGDLYIVISPKETAQRYYSEALDKTENTFWRFYEG